VRFSETGARELVLAFRGSRVSAGYPRTRCSHQ
jgi:hypothetical protein